MRHHGIQVHECQIFQITVRAVGWVAGVPIWLTCACQQQTGTHPACSCSGRAPFPRACAHWCRAGTCRMTFCTFKFALCIFKNVLGALTVCTKKFKSWFLSTNCDFFLKKGIQSNPFCVQSLSACKALLPLGCGMQPLSCNLPTPTSFAYKLAQ